MKYVLDGHCKSDFGTFCFSFQKYKMHIYVKNCTALSLLSSSYISNITLLVIPYILSTFSIFALCSQILYWKHLEMQGPLEMIIQGG